MQTPLTGKRILLGVTGSIACYKTADLASKLRQAGAEVDVILTQSAQQFVSPLTFQSVTGRPAYTDEDLWGNEGHVLHIGLAKDADLFLIAPATANTLAKLAHGIADNLLSLTAVAAEIPIIVAPAMDGGMFSNSATQANLTILKERGVFIWGPASGHLASGLETIGRMLEPQELLDRLRYQISQTGPLSGKQIVVSAGGTQEPLDPVRFIANRSSGKQGFALAQAALDLGAEVTLIAGPNNLTPPFGVNLVNVRTAEEMASAVLEHSKTADVLLMAAAVADFRPETIADNKIKKTAGIPTITLTTNPDILLAVKDQKATLKRPTITVGFAAESQNLLDNATKKLNSKGLDLIVANDISAPDAGFEVDTNRVTLLFANGTQEQLELMSKSEVATTVLKKIAELVKAN